MRILFRLPFFFLMLLLGCQAQTVDTPKINGLSFVASREPIDQKHIDPVVNVGANYAAVMPFGFLRNPQSADIVYDTDRQWYGETKNGAKQYIEELHKNGIKVMLKPQIWIWRGEFTGHIKMPDEDSWLALETAYHNFIVDYATLGQEVGVDILCIGTELEQFVANRPTFWDRLIADVKAVYKGKLTYAANWDEYGRTPFWDQLDYIGIDAYFPVCQKETPTVASAREGWGVWKPGLKAFAKAKKRPILFTEYGYRSMDYAGKEPWKADRNEPQVNMEAQTNALAAIYAEFWDESWFSGGFLWKWFIDHDGAGGVESDRFSPQNKPAEEIVREQYRKS